MYYNLKNDVIENVLTEEDIIEIYEAVQSNSGTNFVDVHSQLNTFINLPQHILDKFTNHAKEVSGNNNLVLTEYCHARYANVTSDCGKLFRPSLFPHVDETFKQPRVTFDYQLNGNVDWDIIVEDRVISLKNNQAGTFSGTHQVHWREPKKFEDDQFIEMIFCHFSDPSEDETNPSDAKAIAEKAAEYKKQFFANGGFSNG